MAIKRPDIYEHNNSDLGIVDSDFINGGFRSPVATVEDLYSLSGKTGILEDPVYETPSVAGQMKEYSTVVYVTGETAYYVLKDIENISNSNGWEVFGSSGSSGDITNITNGLTLVGDDTVTLGGNLTGNTIIDGISLNSFTIDNLTDFSVVSTGLTVNASDEMIITSPDLTISNGANNIIKISTTCNELLDGTNQEGFVYSDDYSVNGSVNPRWIPDNEYVTGLTSGTIKSVTNGLTVIGDTVKLGGTLVEGTSICLGGDTPQTLTIENSGVTSSISAEFSSAKVSLCGMNSNSPNQVSEITSGYDNTLISNGFTNCESSLSMVNSSINMSICGGATNADFIVTDNSTTPRGIEYASDYALTFSDESLITKKYVQSQISGITSAVTTANNGLTKVGQNVVLGGDLTGNIIISGAHSLDFSGLTEFNITANNVDLDSEVIVGNSLSVSGITTLDSTLDVSDVATLMNDLNVSGQTTINSGLTVFDFTLLNNSLNVTSGVTFNDTLDVTGATNIISSLNVDDVVTFNNTLNVISGVTFNDILNVTGATNLGNTLNVISGVTINDTLDVTSAVIFYDTLNVSGVTKLNTVNGGTGDEPLLVRATDGTIKEIPVSNFDITANNGLTNEGNNITLGGGLTGDTIINGAHKLAFTGVTEFDIMSNNIKLNDIINITDTVDINSTLDVSGFTTLSDNLDISGNTHIIGTIIADNTLTLNDVSSGTISDSILVINNGLVKSIDSSTLNVSAGNGLVDNGNYVSLGGVLTGSTVISGDTVFSLTLGSSESKLSSLYVNTNNYNVKTVNGIVSGSTSIINKTEKFSIELSNDDALIVDNTIGVNGLKYSTCISSGFTNTCSLVDKGYVDGKIFNDSNISNVNIISTAYTTLRDDDYVGVSGISTSEVSLYNTPVLGQKLTVTDICGNGLADPIVVNGNGNLINGNLCSIINTDYGSATYLYNGLSWSVISFVN